MNLNQIIEKAQTGDISAAIAIADDRQHWCDGRSTPSHGVTPDEKSAMMALMLHFSKEGLPEALVRLGKCFWHGEGVGENNNAALACWYNAYEIASQEQNRGVCLELGATIPSARKWLTENALHPIDPPALGKLYDISTFINQPS